MSKLTLKVDYYKNFDKGLEEYLLTINGIKQAKINNKKEDIYIEYNPNIISLKVLKLEVLIYLDISKIPSILSFNKHLDNNLEEYKIIIKDLCCEYCLKGMIEELLETNGINSAYSVYDYINDKNVPIFITYDKKILNKNTLEEISKKFNTY